MSLKQRNSKNRIEVQADDLCDLLLDEIQNTDKYRGIDLNGQLIEKETDGLFPKDEIVSTIQSKLDLPLPDENTHQRFIKKILSDLLVNDQFTAMYKSETEINSYTIRVVKS